MRTVLHVDETMFVEDHGFRPVFVVEGEKGWHANGTWPYEGKPGQTCPWFFGPTIDDARRACAHYNTRLGISPQEAAMIIVASMGHSRRQ